MSIEYFKLWDLLNRKKIKKTELKQITGMSSATFAKLSKGESVTIDTISRICKALNVQPGDIMEYVPDGAETRQERTEKPEPQPRAETQPLAYGADTVKEMFDVPESDDITEEQLKAIMDREKKRLGLK